MTRRWPAAAVAGLGITTDPTFILDSYLQDSRLINILKPSRRPAVGIFALYPPGRTLPRRIQIISDLLASRFGDNPYWDEGLEIS